MVRQWMWMNFFQINAEKKSFACWINGEYGQWMPRYVSGEAISTCSIHESVFKFLDINYRPTSFLI